MLARLKFEISGLVKEILNQVDSRLFKSSSTSFLDPAMGGGQFIFETIKRLKEQGHSYDSIKTRVFGYESNILYVNYVRERYLREFGEEIPATLLVGGLDELEALKMKFDLVMGNPPYQINIRNKIWMAFAEKSIKLLKPNGLVLFITPNAWKKNLGDFKKIYNLISQNLIAMNDCNDSFPGIGEDIGYWIYSNDPSIPKMKVEFDKSIIEGIFEKVKKTGDFWHYRDFTSTTYDFSRVQTPVYSYPVYQTASQLVYVKPSEIKYFGWKVLVNNSGYFPKSPNDTKYCLVSDSIGAGGGSFGIKVNSEQEGYNVLSWVTSKLYRALVNGKKTSGFNQIFVSLSYLGADKTWTDQELYEHFNLTDEEIRYIEEQIRLSSI